jgi:hypothetical protein
MAFGEGIQVQQEVVIGICGFLFTEMDGVLLAFFGTREIEIAAKAGGNRQIGLLDTAEHFLVELFLKSFGAGKHGVGVSVFGVEVGDDFGIIFIVEPVVWIDAAVFVNDVFDRMATRDGWNSRAGWWRGGIGVGFGSHGPRTSSGIGWPVQNNLAAGFCPYYIERILDDGEWTRGRRRS